MITLQPSRQILAAIGLIAVLAAAGTGVGRASADDAAAAAASFIGTGSNSQERLVSRRSARLALVAKPAAPPEVDAPVANTIDRFIVARWRENPLAPAADDPPLCRDSTFLRRAYLDVVGAVPTIAETKRFLDDVDENKRVRLIDELLARSQDYAAHWTPFWLDALASNTAATFGGVVTRGDHLHWVHASFVQNKPYDIFVAELLDPTMPEFKQPGAIDILGIRYSVGFLRGRDHKEVLQTAADVGQIFLGTGMKCAGCHSHFDNDEWPQQRFLAFAGYFSERDLERIRCEKRSGEIVPAASPFDQPGAPKTAPADAQARLHLAALLVTDPVNPRFAKTLVNRLWKRFMGVGLFEPADDFRLDTPASHPALLDWLAYDFIEHGCDIKRTMRLILTSRTWQLEHNPALEDALDPSAPKHGSRAFRSPSLRRLTAEQLLDSIAVITRQTLDDSARVYRVNEGVPGRLTSALGRPDIRSEVSTARSGGIAVVQALELLNGAQYNSLMHPDLLIAAAGETADPASITNLVYLAALQRHPSDRELELGGTFLSASTTDGLSLRDAVSDMLWSIVTSPAFQFVH